MQSDEMKLISLYSESDTDHMEALDLEFSDEKIDSLCSADVELTDDEHNGDHDYGTPDCDSDMGITQHWRSRLVRMSARLLCLLTAISLVCFLLYQTQWLTQI
jgi:hypothetical protein